MTPIIGDTLVLRYLRHPPETCRSAAFLSLLPQRLLPPSLVARTAVAAAVAVIVTWMPVAAVSLPGGRARERPRRGSRHPSSDRIGDGGVLPEVAPQLAARDPPPPEQLPLGDA